MTAILVTGANKGIGLAVVESVLREQTHYRVVLGCRDRARGEVARDALLQIDSAWSERIEVLELDVACDQSVLDASEHIAASGSDGCPPLYGLVNNAGRGSGTVSEVLAVNVYGIHRMSAAFASLIDKGGRIVNVTSASGPNFVARCTPQRQAFFLDSGMTWQRLEQFMHECAELPPGDSSILGMESLSPYGLSKACANSYTMCLARCHPQLFVNACTPGFIETDLGQEFLGGRTPAQAGMKSPAEGARVVMSLLFEQPRGTGHYYGSDGLRSPMDCYRAPGEPEFTDDR